MSVKKSELKYNSSTFNRSDRISFLQFICNEPNLYLRFTTEEAVSSDCSCFHGESEFQACTYYRGL